MPDLPGRYAYGSTREQTVEKPAHEAVEYVRQQYVPCLGGCGELVPPGQKCAPCATEAVDAWLVRSGGIVKSPAAPTKDFPPRRRRKGAKSAASRATKRPAAVVKPPASAR